MSSKVEMVEMLCNASEENGIVETIKAVFGDGVRVSIPFSSRDVDVPIEEIDFSVRASNCLHRANKKTIGEIIDALHNNELPHYRNIGKRTISEIKTKLLVYGYYKLSNNEKRKFWDEFLIRNCRNYQK